MELPREPITEPVADPFTKAVVEIRAAHKAGRGTVRRSWSDGVTCECLTHSTPDAAAIDRLAMAFGLVVWPKDADDRVGELARRMNQHE